MSALVLLSCLLWPPVLAQVEPPSHEDDGAAAIEALVERIQENLGRIDETLFSTLDADDPTSTLETVRQTHMTVIRDLEELINQTKYQPGGGGGGGGGSSSDSPTGEQSGEESAPRESDGSNSPEPGEGETPQPPGGEEEGEGEGGQEPMGADGEGQDPADQLDDSAPARNEEGGPPPPEARDDPVRESTDARWGLLPPKLQERLMNLHVDDVPARYRDWLSAYIRAMQRLEETDGR